MSSYTPQERCRPNDANESDDAERTTPTTSPEPTAAPSGWTEIEGKPHCPKCGHRDTDATAVSHDPDGRNYSWWQCRNDGAEFGVLESRDGAR